MNPKNTTNSKFKNVLTTLITVIAITLVSTSQEALSGSVGISNQNVTPLHAEGLDGSGIPIAVFDDGWADWDHPDLAGRVFHDETFLDLNRVPLGRWAQKGPHATHMTGIIASSGVGNPAAKGIAPASKIYSYLMPGNYQIGKNALILLQAALYGWRVSNHSYSDGWPCADPWTEPCKSSPLWSSYIQESQNMDTWAYEANLLSVTSAGNNGMLKNGSDSFADDNWSTIYNGGTGKNAISVCAAADSPYGGYKYSLYLSTAKGPTSDGRIKPDLCALGNGGDYNDLTTDLDGKYSLTCATSPASAQVTGIVALLQQKYKLLYGNASELPAELAKLLLIHTAKDLHSGNAFWWWNQLFPLRGGVGPDYITGWGYVDATAAAQAMQAANYRTNHLSQNDTHEYTVTVPAYSNLKTTLIWLDPPAAVGTGKALVNDLDLKVQNLDGSTEHLPWVLDPEHPANPATTGVNTRDNVEQVLFLNMSPTARTYRIFVKGTTIPQGPQSYYLISTANFSTANNIVLYGTTSAYDGNLGGRSGADAKCELEKVSACSNATQFRAVLTLSTSDDLQNMQANYNIPTGTPVVGSKGNLLSNSWSGIINSNLPLPLDQATNLPAGSNYWSGSGVGGAAPTTAATSGSDYLCAGFTSNTKEHRATLGKSTVTPAAGTYSAGWNGSNVYPSCAANLKLLCVCW